jgi:hypothetical protein
MVNSLPNLEAVHLDRNGLGRIVFREKQVFPIDLGHQVFGPSSAIESTTFLPLCSQLELRTVQGDVVVFNLPSSDDLAPAGGRPTIYLDQNHWSTVSAAIHEPARLVNADERSAALRLIGLASAEKVLLPMSSAHLSETCKQTDPVERYKRALTIAQLSFGWQFRDPLHLRDLELRRALSKRYGRPPIPIFEAVTLEPNALHAIRTEPESEVGTALPEDVEWSIHVMRHAVGILDALLDAEPVLMTLPAGWKLEFQQFAMFLSDNPTGVGMKRRRTHAKFMADLGLELAKAAHGVGISPQQMSDWALHHSDSDLRRMPALGIFREVLHEKLCDVNLRWHDNDLVDMMYLTSAAGYCDHVVAERSHASHIQNAIKRHGQGARIHRNLRSLVVQLGATADRSAQI